MKVHRRTDKSERQTRGGDPWYALRRHHETPTSGPRHDTSDADSEPLLRLQRTHGNQAVQRLVTERRNSTLDVGRPGDEYEREAEEVTDRVMRMSTHRVQRTATVPTERSSARSRPDVVPTGGRPLDRRTRSFFEPRFGQAFDDVRVHTDAKAADAARAVDAHAYTAGSHIVFGEGAFSPETATGRRLLAHELTHVVQQSSTRDGGDLVHRNAPLRIARQPITNPVLTPEELFEIVVRERAWTFNRGGPPVEDPAGVGRGVGPAAGGRRAGSAVFAVIQVTDRNGNPVALTYGEHVRYGEPHAEQGAVAALRRTVPADANLTGGRMTVVLDQVPCPPGRQNCLGLLTSYARQHGLELDIRLPTRERVRGGGTVAPRTATMSSQRTDVPTWRLERYQPPGTPGPTGSGPGPATGGGGGGPRPLPPVVPRRQVPSAPPALIRERARLISTLDQQTTRSVRFNSRLSTYLGVAGRLFEILDLVSTASDAMKLAAEGTVLGEAERAADHVVEQAREAKTWAEETTDSISLLTATILVGDAIERGDSDALFDLSSAHGDLADELRTPAERFEELSQRLTAQAAAMDVVKDAYKTLVSVPQGATTAPNAQAFAMYVSLERLSGRIRSAATYYREAHVTLTFVQTFLEDLSYRANREAWALVFGDIARAQAEIGRQQEAASRAERRTELRLRIAANEARVAEPVSILPAELEALHRERERLLAELRALEEN